MGMHDAKRKGRRGKYESGAVYLEECRGLSFDAVLKRLVLLHQANVPVLRRAGHRVQEGDQPHLTVVHQDDRWLLGIQNRIRQGQADWREYLPVAWRLEGQGLVAVAMEATCAGRLRSLKILLGEVKRRWDILP